MALKPRLFHVVSVNCKCSSYWWGRFRRPQGSGYWMHCRYCRKTLGDFEYQYHGTIRTTTETQAIEQMRAKVIAERQAPLISRITPKKAAR